MAFWGIEVKPGKPYTHIYDKAKGRLRVCQATLGTGSADSATNRFLVQCNIGNKSPVLLCSLCPDHSYSCPIGVEFEESQDVIFSLIGPCSVHLVGYYLSNNSHSHGIDESESYGEDISNTEGSYRKSDVEENYEDSFINDDDPEFFSPSPISEDRELKSERKNPKTGGLRKHRKMYQTIDSDDEYNIQPQTAIDKDEFLNQTSERNNGSGGGIEFAAELQEANPKFISSKKKTEIPVFDNNSASSKQKKRKKSIVEEVAAFEDGRDKQNAVNREDEGEVKNLGKDLQTKRTRELDSTNKSNQINSKERKKRKREKKNVETKMTFNGDVSQPLIEKDSIPLKDFAKMNAIHESLDVQTLSSGLVIEELELGEANGRVAFHGKKVRAHYTGRLKDGGQIIDSNIERSPLKFRLGSEDVIDGLNIGMDGMKAGGKRKLTIPPSLGFGSKGYADKVPPNSWLVYDIELVKVH